MQGNIDFSFLIIVKSVMKNFFARQPKCLNYKRMLSYEPLVLQKHFIIVSCMPEIHLLDTLHFQFLVNKQKKIVNEKRRKIYENYCEEKN